ncbi:MAG: hypothetical protein GF331_18610 [Chitinivibrionales bacterium]|nr:hypothetical protein [Chitinivibrionales bacterium]
MVARIHASSEDIAEFCRRNRIRKLAFFGSVLRDDFAAESDLPPLIGQLKRAQREDTC